MSYLKINLILVWIFFTLLITNGVSDPIERLKVVFKLCPESVPFFPDLQIPLRDGQIISISSNESSCGGRTSKEDKAIKIKSIFITRNETTTRGKNVSIKRDELLPETSHQDIYITSDGIMRIAEDYYHPQDYCILRFNTSHIDLKICTNATTIANNFSSCKKNSGVCIPKCCGLDEVLEFDGFKPICKPSGTGLVQWRPILYKNPYKKSEFKITNYEIVEDSLKNRMAKCEEFQKFPARNLFQIRPHWKKVYWRLLDDASVTILNDYRRWEAMDDKPGFCVDGLQNVDKNGTVYSGDEEDQIILVCRTPSFSAANNETDLESEKDLLYLALCYVSAFFYLLTTLVYLIIFSKKNSNVWTILGYVGSLLILKTLVGTCYLMNYLSATNPKLEIEVNTWTSWCLAVSTHFFVLSSYTWIVLMSFDLMKTIKSRTPISAQGKRRWMFCIYCLIGWGLPFMTITLFVVIDHVFADPITEVIVPEYGVYNFFIPPEAQGIYMYYIITGILLVNLIFAVISMMAMLSSRRNSQTFSGGDLSFKSSEYISFQLFIKLFVLTGSLWFLEVISWLHAGQSNPWYYVLTDIIVQLQSVFTFIILVCNTRTLKTLKTKFSNMMGDKKIMEILQLQLFRKVYPAPRNSVVTTLNIVSNAEDVQK